jgi:hypothetical protein
MMTWIKDHVHLLAFFAVSEGGRIAAVQQRADGAMPGPPVPQSGHTLGDGHLATVAETLWAGDILLFVSELRAQLTSDHWDEMACRNRTADYAKRLRLA